MTFDPFYYTRGSISQAKGSRRNIEPAMGYLRYWEISNYDFALALRTTPDNYRLIGPAIVNFVVSHAAPLNDFISFHFRDIFAEEEKDNPLRHPPKQKEGAPSLTRAEHVDFTAFKGYYALKLHSIVEAADPEPGTAKGGKGGKTPSAPKPPRQKRPAAAKPARIDYKTALNNEEHPIATWFIQSYDSSNMSYIHDMWRPMTDQGKREWPVRMSFEYARDFQSRTFSVIQRCLTDPLFMEFFRRAHTGTNFLTKADPYENTTPISFNIPSMLPIGALDCTYEDDSTLSEVDSQWLEARGDEATQGAPKGAAKGRAAKGRAAKGRAAKGAGEPTKQPGGVKAVKMTAKEYNVGLGPLRKMTRQINQAFEDGLGIWSPAGRERAVKLQNKYLEVRPLPC